MNVAWIAGIRKTLLSFLSIALLGLLVGCAGLKSRAAVQDEFDHGLSLFNRGHYEKAIPHFEKAIALDPEFGKAYLYLGRSHLNLGKWKEAIPPLRTAYRLSPEETRAEIADILIDMMLKQITRMEDVFPEDNDAKGGDTR